VTRSIVAPQAPLWDPLWPGQCGMLEGQLLSCVHVLQLIEHATACCGFSHVPPNEREQTWGIDDNHHAFVALQRRGYVMTYTANTGTRTQLTDAGRAYLAQIIAERAGSFTYGRCEALCTRLASSGMTGDDRVLFAMCNMVLYGTDADRATARARLAACSVRVAEIERLAP
jgi:hypothetical protein